MGPLPLATVQDRLSDIVDEVHRTHERVVITRDGIPVAAIVSTDDLECISETLDILGDPSVMEGIRQGIDDIAHGDVYDAQSFTALVEQARVH